MYFLNISSIYGTYCGSNAESTVQLQPFYRFFIKYRGNYFGIWYDEIWLGSSENRDYEGITGFANTGWPYFLILDKDLRIRVVQQGWNKEQILQHIADLKTEL